MDDELKKHAMLLFLGIISCALINIKLTSSKREKIKKPMREKVSVLIENGLDNEVDDDSDGSSKKDNNKVIQITEKINISNDLVEKENWVEFLNMIYDRMSLNESVIVYVQATRLALVSALIRGCFEKVSKPIVIVSNEEDFEDGMKLISTYTTSYIVTILNGIILRPEAVSNPKATTDIIGSKAVLKQEFKDAVKPSSDIFYKRPDTTPTINILKLHPGVDYEKMVYCALAYSDAVVIDNTMNVDLRLDVEDDEKFENRILLVVGKGIKVKSKKLQVLHDPNFTPEYGLIKLYVS